MENNSDFRSFSSCEVVCLDTDDVVLLIVRVTALDKERVSLKVKPLMEQQPLSHCGFPEER